MVPAAVSVTLSSKWELTTCNTFFSAIWWTVHLFPVFHQADAERTMANWYHMLCSDHWLPPLQPRAPLPAEHLRLSQLSHCISLFTLFTEPKVVKVLLEKLEETLRCCRCQKTGLSSRLVQQRLGADTLYSLILDPADRLNTALM